MKIVEGGSPGDAQQRSQGLPGAKHQTHSASPPAHLLGVEVNQLPRRGRLLQTAALPAAAAAAGTTRRSGPARAWLFTVPAPASRVLHPEGTSAAQQCSTGSYAPHESVTHARALSRVATCMPNRCSRLLSSRCLRQRGSEPSSRLQEQAGLPAAHAYTSCRTVLSQIRGVWPPAPAPAAALRCSRPQQSTPRAGLSTPYCAHSGSGSRAPAAAGAARRHRVR